MQVVEGKVSRKSYVISKHKNVCLPTEAKKILLSQCNKMSISASGWRQRRSEWIET